MTRYTPIDLEHVEQLNQSLAELNLSVRATNCLESEGINTVRDLVSRTEDQLLTVRNFGETTLVEVREQLSALGLRLAMSVPEPEHLEQTLNQSLAELKLSVRATNCLESEGINTVRDLVSRTEDQLLTVRNFGETTLVEVRERLSALGLRLAMSVPEPEHLEQTLNQSLAELKLSVRATNCLESEGINTVRDLVSRTEDQLLTVRNFGETTLVEVRERLSALGLRLAMSVPEPEHLEQTLNQSLAELKLSVRATNCLESEGINTVRDLVSRTEDQLLTVRNFGETTLVEVRERLSALGLRLGMSVPEPEHLEQTLNQSLAELKLSVRATNCLESEGINTVRDLVSRTEDQLLTVRNFGETTLVEVRERLSALGLRLGMDVSTPSATAENAISSTRGVPPFEILIDAGGASAEVIQDVLERLSDFHIASGGLGLEFEIDGIFVRARDGAVQ